MKRYYNLDIARGLAVIFVVFIHIRFPGWLGVLGQDLGSLCNNLFFLISGFFAYNNSNKKLIRKSLRCFVLAYGSYLFYALINRCTLESIVIGLPEVLLANVTNAGNLWFAVAIGYCYLIYLLVGRKKYSHLLILLLLIHLTIRDFYPQRYNCILCSFLDGLPLFMLGEYMAYRKSEGIKEVSNSTVLIMLVIGMIVNLVNFLGDSHFIEFVHRVGGVVYSFSIFIWAIFGQEIQKRNKALGFLERIGSNYYVYYFVFQVLAISLVKNTCDRFLSWEGIDYFKPIMVVFTLYVLSFFITEIRGRLYVFARSKIFKEK